MGKYSFSDHQDKRREQRRPAAKPRQPIKRPAPKTVTNKKQPAIKKVGEKLSLELRHYAVLSKDYLRDHPKCQCGRADCRRSSQEIHHRRGRGKYLNEVKYFLAVARVCHQWIHENDAQSRELGLILSRLAKDPEDVHDVTIDLEEGKGFEFVEEAGAVNEHAFNALKSFKGVFNRHFLIGEGSPDKENFINKPDEIKPV